MLNTKYSKIHQKYFFDWASWNKLKNIAPFVYNKVKRVEAFNCIFTQFGLENMQSQWLPSPDKSVVLHNYIPNFSQKVILMFNVWWGICHDHTKWKKKSILGWGGGEIIIWESWESGGGGGVCISLFLGIHRYLSCSLYYYEWENTQGF